jgi:hypothetical protein
MLKSYVCVMGLQIFLKKIVKEAYMKKVSLILVLISCTYGSMQQMVVADIANNNAASIDAGRNAANDNANNSVLYLAAQAKDDLPPALKSSLLRDLQHKNTGAVTNSAKPNIATAVRDLENNTLYSTPHLSNSAVLSWANEAIVATFSYDFINIEKTKQMISNYYTPSGWKIMGEAHNEIGDEISVLKEHLVASAVAVSAPKIIEQKNIENRYSWLIEMPVLLTFVKDDYMKNNKLLARFLVVRDNPQVHDRGLAINNISLKKILDKPVYY